MSCARSRNSCRTVAKATAAATSTATSIECVLQEARAEDRLEYLFQKAVQRFRSNKTVNIDYANEYLTRSRESDLGTLVFFIVDDLLDTLNLTATRKVFEAQSGFMLKKVKNADTIKVMYSLAENVKLLDTIAEKTLDWYLAQQQKEQPGQQGGECNMPIEQHVWGIWDLLNLSEYIRMYKEMYEGMPGEEARTFFESTSLHTLLHHCHPDRTAHVIEYTVSSAEPVPVCSRTEGSRGPSKSRTPATARKSQSRSNVRTAGQSSVRKRASTVQRT